MVGGAGGGFEHGGGETGGLALGHDDPLGAESVGCADDGAEVVRVLDLVEKDQQSPGFRQTGEQLVEVGVSGRRLVGDDALVVGAGEAVELGLVAQVIGDSRLAGEVEDLVDDRTVRALGDEQAAEGSFGA